MLYENERRALKKQKDGAPPKVQKQYKTTLTKNKLKNHKH